MGTRETHKWEADTHTHCSAEQGQFRRYTGTLYYALYYTLYYTQFRRYTDTQSACKVKKIVS